MVNHSQNFVHPETNQVHTQNIVIVERPQGVGEKAWNQDPIPTSVSVKVFIR